MPEYTIEYTELHEGYPVPESARPTSVIADNVHDAVTAVYNAADAFMRTVDDSDPKKKDHVWWFKVHGALGEKTRLTVREGDRVVLDGTKAGWWTV